MERAISVIGLLVFIGIGYAVSSSRKNIHWRTIAGGVALQLLFALFILKTDIGMGIFNGARAFFNAILAYAGHGAGFIFGSLADIPLMGKVFGQFKGWIFAIQVPAVIILTASLSAVLYHLKILQIFVWLFAKLMHFMMRISGAESLSCAANIFAGQTEAPLIVRPYLNNMTRSEIMTMMTGGFATIAGGVFAAFVGFGVDAGHLLTASVISAPAAVVMAKLMIPEMDVPETEGKVSFAKDFGNHANIFDAACTGAKEGLHLSLNVLGMLVAFIALIALFNGGLAYVSMGIEYVLGLFSVSMDVNLTLESIFATIFWPISWLMGIPAAECGIVGNLLGKKMVINEFVAYMEFSSVKEMLSERSQIIVTYALCGFANFSSIAIQIGGIGTLVPKRKHELAKLGFRAMIAGTIACLMTANIAALLIS